MYETLPFHNDCSNPVKLILEPFSEFFIIPPGQKVEIHAVLDDNAIDTTFIIASNDSGLVVYAPGELTSIVDCYVSQDGVRLSPDGN